jgi:hypothetical protein
MTGTISGVTSVEGGSCALSVVPRSPAGDTLREHRHFRLLPEVTSKQATKLVLWQKGCVRCAPIRLRSHVGFGAGLFACTHACVRERLWCGCVRFGSAVT